MAPRTEPRIPCADCTTPLDRAPNNEAGRSGPAMKEFACEKGTEGAILEGIKLSGRTPRITVALKIQW